MNISWNGLSSFEIVAKTAAQEVSIVIDPYDNQTGLRFPRTLSADMVLVSHDEKDANNVAAVQGAPFQITEPGEYEVKDVFVFAISAPRADGKANLLFRIEAEGMQVAHLGALDRELTDEELRQLQNIDILMVPVGGGKVMSPKMASGVIGQVEPRVIVPMTHAIPNLKEELAPVNDFCKAMGACRQEEASKFKVARKDLPEEDMMIMKLTR